MRSMITVRKHSYGYVVVQTNGSGRAFTRVLGSQHPEAAAEAAMTAWEDNRNNPDGVTVEVPPEIVTILIAHGPLPWDFSGQTSAVGYPPTKDTDS